MATTTTNTNQNNVFILKVGERRSSVPVLDKADVPSFVEKVLNEAKSPNISGLLLRHHDGVSLVRVVTPLDETEIWVFCSSCGTTMNEATWKKHRLLKGDNSCKKHPGRVSPDIKVVTEEDVPDNFWSEGTGKDTANPFSPDDIPHDGTTTGVEASAAAHNENETGGVDLDPPKVAAKKTKMPKAQTAKTTTSKTTKARKQPAKNVTATEAAKPKAYNTRHKP